MSSFSEVEPHLAAELEDQLALPGGVDRRGLGQGGVQPCSLIDRTEHRFATPDFHLRNRAEDHGSPVFDLGSAMLAVDKYLIDETFLRGLQRTLGDRTPAHRVVVGFHDTATVVAGGIDEGAVTENLEGQLLDAGLTDIGTSQVQHRLAAGDLEQGRRRYDVSGVLPEERGVEFVVRGFRGRVAQVLEDRYQGVVLPVGVIGKE